MELTYDHVAIVIDVPNKVVSGTVLKRKATLFSMTYNQINHFLVLKWIVEYYVCGEDDSYGPKIDSPGIVAYARESVADNETKVVPETGEILIPDVNGDYEDRPFMGQYNFFNMLAEHTQVNVHQLIRNYGYALQWD